MTTEDSSPLCLRLRGIPFSSTEKDIREFFRGLDVTDVKFIFNDDGRLSGECYCMFGNEIDLEVGMAKDRETMGRRYIEGSLELFTFEKKAKLTPLNDNKGYIRAIGLPFKCSKDDVFSFFKDFNVEEVVLGKEPGEGGRPTGEAFVRFGSKEEAEKAMRLDGQHLGHRYLKLKVADVRLYERFKHKSHSGTSFSERENYMPQAPRFDPYAIKEPDYGRSGSMRRGSNFGGNRFMPYDYHAFHNYPVGSGYSSMPEFPGYDIDQQMTNFMRYDNREFPEKGLFPAYSHRDKTSSRLDEISCKYAHLGPMWNNFEDKVHLMLNTQASGSTFPPYDYRNEFIPDQYDGGVGGYNFIRDGFNSSDNTSFVGKFNVMDKYFSSKPYDRTIDGAPSYAENGRNFGVQSSGIEFPLAPTKIHMRGLPFRVTGAQIEEFFAPLQCVEIKVGFFEDGRATGDGYVEFSTVREAEQALKKDHETLGKRYIELFSPPEIKSSTIKLSKECIYRTIGGTVVSANKNQSASDNWIR